jgi:hypothetical protein
MMFSRKIVPALTVVLAFSATQQDAQSIIETMQEKQVERWETVDNYTVVQSVLGQQSPIYYEKIFVGEERRPAFRRVPISEYQEQLPGGTQSAMGHMADGYEMMADSMEGQGMPSVGTGPMLRDMAVFMREGASAEIGDGREDAARRSEEMGEIAQRARLVGRETVDGRETFVLRAEDLSDIEMEQPNDEGKFTLHTMSLWIDAKQYVPLRLKMDGEAESDGKSMPITIEKLDQDYRQVGPLYEPHRQVLRMTGAEAALDPKQREELEKSRAQMEELKAQLAEMPEAQRRFVEGRMKSAMEQMERMSGDGSMFETVIEVVSMRINQGPPTTVASGASPVQRSEPDAVVDPKPAVDGVEQRSDLTRFQGVYGVRPQSATPRNLFVTQSCSGQLVAGAMWGDASNWWMTPVSDTEFEMSSSFMSVHLEFEVGPDGAATALRHDVDGLPSPLTRLGPLPDEWGECVRDTRG